jgi:hypothetical protein
LIQVLKVRIESNLASLEMFSPSPLKIQPKYQPRPTNFEAQNCNLQFPIPIDIKEAEKSTSVIASQLKGLYGELGTMLATKQQEIDGQSRFISAPMTDSIPNYDISSQNFDESLRANTKFVRIPHDQEHFKQEENLESMVETWKSNDFDKINFNNENYGNSSKGIKELERPKKFTNYSAPSSDSDEIDEDVNPDEFIREHDSDEKIKGVESKFKEQEEKWDQHKELLEARKMLENAMKDANFLMENEQDMDDLATNTHKQEQMHKIGNINDQMDEIESMINQQNQSNLKRKPMENSIDSIKTDTKPNVIDSGRDPFDKLEDIGRSVDQEEMRKTAKSHKSTKRLPWGKSKAKVGVRTDYNQEPEKDDDNEDEDDDNEDEDDDNKDDDNVQQDEDEVESEKATPVRKSRGDEEVMKSQQNKAKESGRYDYQFENTDEQKQYDVPVPYDPTKDFEQDDDDQDFEDKYNIANTSLQNSVSVFSADREEPKRESKTQENFRRG